MNFTDTSEFIITEDATILQAMEQIDKSTRKILFVHSDGKLLAAVSDGDIRRWILKGGKLNESIKNAANYQPIFIKEDKRYQAERIMKKNTIDALPIINEEGQIKEIVFLNKFDKEYDRFTDHIPVVIMAGGTGSRLLPYTNILPKPLIPIGELPIVEHIINQFRKFGCDDFRMIVNYKRNMIKAYFNELEKDYSLTFVSEEKPLGTGGGLSLLKGSIQGTFILTNCDILIDEDFGKAYRHHKEQGNEITMICSLKNYILPYGIVNIGQNGNINSIQEKPEMSFYTNTGCYFVESEVVERLTYNEFVDFPNIISEYLAEGRKVGVYPISEHAWLDMGQMDEMEKMKARLEC